jgi:hypothetical protein
VKLNALRPAADLYGDVVTAYADVSRNDAQAQQEVELRVRGVAEQAMEGGADRAVVDAVSERLLQPTGLGGTTSRVVVAQGADPVVDAVLATEVVSDGHHGPIARLAGLAKAVAEDVRHALVLVDHTGADITVADTVGTTHVDFRTEGEHDVIHKVRGGGWSHRRYQARADDSWDRNADEVAHQLDRIVTREDPEVVLLAGEERSCARIMERATGRVAERLQRIEHGSRAEGASDERLAEDVAAAIQRRRTARIDAVLDRLGAAENRRAVGVADTVEALRRGEVETLLLLDGALDGREAAVGPEPLHLGHTDDEVRALGVDEPGTEALEEAVVRAALGQDAGLLPLHAPVPALPDGVGAVLRFDSRPG